MNQRFEALSSQEKHDFMNLSTKIKIGLEMISKTECSKDLVVEIQDALKHLHEVLDKLKS